MQELTITVATTDPTLGWATLDDLEAVYGERLDLVTAEAYPRGTCRVTMMGQNTAELSRAVSAIGAECNAQDQRVADVWIMGAPAECANAVHHGFAAKLDALAQTFGFADVEDVWQTLGARTSYRTAYNLVPMYTA